MPLHLLKKALAWANQWRTPKVKMKGHRVKDSFIREVRRREETGLSLDGKVYNVDVIVRSPKGKEKTVRMAEKEFYPKNSNVHSDFPNLFSPKKQFQAMQELKELNRGKKLGLRIRPTVRLLTRNGKKTLVMTRLNLPKKLSEEQEKESKQDMQRQRIILKKEGYTAEEDTFFRAVDPKTGKGIAIIADFGSIFRLNWKERLYARLKKRVL
ncbi:MAG: hypothetical protein HY917_04805 [Candidatus Diapherotrites archaeon]|nr:hypothetical protein [Candidatus Diapherotrites archaeon]